MRIALLSAVRCSSQGELVALFPFLGRTVLVAQFDRACELGAERIVCLASSQSAEILALQHEAELRGVDFHLISGHLALVGLLAADHELIVFQDGILIDRSAIAAEMRNVRGILVVPADAGVAMGLERIDTKWSWAGLFIVRGDAAAKLPDLPSDGDPASLLLRLALQARVAMEALNGDQVSAGAIMRIDDAEALAKHEALILNDGLAECSWLGPGTKLANLGVKMMLPKALDWGNRLAIGGGVLSLIALALAAIGQAVLGCIVLTFAAILFTKLEAVEGLLASVSNRTLNGRKILRISILLDFSIIVVLCLSLWPNATWATFALVLIAMGLIRLAGQTAQRSKLTLWQDFLQDRLILTLGLTVGIFWGAIVPILVTLSLAMLAFALICEEGGVNSR